MTYWDDLSAQDLSKSQLAALHRLEKKAAITMALEMDDALAASLEQIYAAIVDLRSAIAGLPAPVVNLPAPVVTATAPEVYVPPPDLSEIVTAVTNLHPGPTAAEIAAALADVLAPARTTEDTAPLREVAEALRLLDHRLKGVGTQAYGGGSVSLAPGQVVTTTQTVETSGTSTVTAVASSATVVTLLAANAARKAAYVFNDSTANLFLKLGTGASAASFTVKLTAGSFYEIPTRPTYTGEITGIWSAVNGNALVTEMT